MDWSVSSPTLSRCRWLALLGSALLAGCAHYAAKPLPTQAASAATISALRGIGDVSTPLDMAAVEHLVLLNNPDLLTARERHQIAQAQRRQDGVLPNPTVGGSIGYLISGPGDSKAWTASISEDITALITLRPRRDAARAVADEVDASLLWEQWQTLGKTRLLVIDLVEGERMIRLQQHAVDALTQRETRILKAIDQHQFDRLTAAPDLAAAADARTALDDLQRRHLDQQQQLAALLGLKPDVAIPLATTLAPASVDAGDVRRESDSIQRRRPDLVALQLGYQAQEASLRAAVLAQFPPLSLGYETSQDNSRVRNHGPAVTFALPIFDHNQGNIAIASATREQLYHEYSTRLATSHDEVDALLSQYAQMQAQWQALVPVTSDAQHASAQAMAASQQGLVDLRSAVDLDVAAVNRQLAALTLEQALLEQQAALELLVGRGMPTSLDKDVLAP